MTPEERALSLTDRICETPSVLVAADITDAIREAVLGEREACARAVESLTGQDSHEWAQAVRAAARVIRERPPALPPAP